MNFVDISSSDYKTWSVITAIVSITIAAHYQFLRVAMLHANRHASCPVVNEIL